MEDQPRTRRILVTGGPQIVHSRAALHAGSSAATASFPTARSYWITCQAENTRKIHQIQSAIKSSLPSGAMSVPTCAFSGVSEP